MKRAIPTLIAVLIATMTPAPIAGANPLDAIWSPVATIAVGTGPDDLAYLMHVEGASARGPQALALAPTGDLYVLDSVGHRVLVVGQRGERRTISTPMARYARDILVTSRAMYLLDDDNRILELDLDGSLRRSIPLPSGLPTHEVFRLAEGPSGAINLWAGGYQVFDLASLPSQVDLEAPLLAKGQGQSNGRGVSSPDGQRWRGELSGPFSGRLVAGNRAIDLKSNGMFGSVRIIGFDRVGQAYVLFEDLYDGNGRVGVELTVRRYNAGGLMTGAARLPFEEFAIAPRRTAEVAPDGSVYVMVPGATRVSLYRVALGSAYRSKVPINPTRKASTGTPRAASPLRWGTSLTRSEVIDRADQVAFTGWYWHNSYDQHPDGSPRGGATKPSQLVGAYDGQYFQGVPYLWGGFDTPWSYSDWGADLWSNWAGALNRYYSLSQPGPLVGNTTDTVYYSSAGLDCAGFVYAALGDTANPKKGTTSLMSDGLAAGVATAGQPGDYFANSAHTFFYHYRRVDGLGMNTLEETTDGSPQAAKRYSRTFSDAASYSHRSWWPYGTGEGPFQAYTVWNSASSCLRGMNTWYSFTVNGGTNVTVSGISGGDVDLYVYRQSDYALVGSSANGGTANELVPINPGTYFAVVHQWSPSVCVSWSMWW